MKDSLLTVCNIQKAYAILNHIAKKQGGYLDLLHQISFNEAQETISIIMPIWFTELVHYFKRKHPKQYAAITLQCVEILLKDIAFQPISLLQKQLFYGIADYYLSQDPSLTLVGDVFTMDSRQFWTHIDKVNANATIH